MAFGVTQGMCNTMKQAALLALLTAGEASGGFYVALFKQSLASTAGGAVLDKDTATYTGCVGEMTSTGYTAGGKRLTGGSVAVDQAGDFAYLTFADPSWTGVTFTEVDAAMVYRYSDKVSLGVFTFAPVTTANGPFNLQMPAVGATALFKIA